ncbi:M48 family metallopeptidase [Lachnoanaerobaculum gingivalis]|uniref:M48 metallopeptidase family protein n=1 Tax=Lachnoanaerobaculum gingivalis TaxID=2490855 RepID=UPI0024A70397|nr:M48 family metallopeptidase [Lachnoanaerobaculum gingivalis]WHE87395.1 M48 family metallopeptidase [Lachnoanaerobaculum gingivalis]
MKFDENYHIILPIDKYENMVRLWMYSDGNKIFKEKLNDFAKQMNVHFNMVRIKNVKTIWGSCSSKKNLNFNFNFKLFFLPEALIDYVFVHELAHLKHMNHSEAFWSEVEKQIPDYKKRREELKRYI